jgi:hypothetical protein
MAGLAKDKRTLPFIRGVDTKTDSKMLDPGELAVLVNGAFKRTGALGSRSGYDQIGGALPAPPTGFGTLESELDAFSGQALYAFSQGGNAWIQKGYVRATKVATRGVAADATNSLRRGDAAMGNNNTVVVYAWINPGTQTLYAAAYDWLTGAAIVAPTVLSGTAFTCQVIAEGTFLYVYYSSGTSVFQQALNVTNPTAGFAAPGTVVNADLVNHQWSVLYCGGTIAKAVITWRSSAAANQPKVATCSGGALGATHTFGVAFNDFKGAFNLGFDSRSNSVICMNQTSTGVLGIYVFSSALALSGSFTVGVSSTVLWTNATALANKLGTITILATQRPTNPGPTLANRTVLRIVTNNVGANLGSSTLLLDFELASEAFVETSGNVHAWVRNYSTFQPGYFLVDESGNCIAKAFYGQAAIAPIAAGGSTPDTYQLPRVWSAAASNIFNFAAPILGAFESDPSGQTVALAAVGQVSLDVSNERFRPVQLGKNLIINGSVLSAYDGTAITELGFHLLPETPSAVVVGNWVPNHVYSIGDWVRPNPQNGFVYLCINGGTSLNPGPPAWGTTIGGLTADNAILWINVGATNQQMTDGTRSYFVVYEWTDAASQVHRSGVSIPMSVTVAGGGGVATTVLIIPTLKLTSKAAVRCTVYRTVAAGTLPQRAGFVVNNPSTEQVYFIDGNLDSSIVTAPILYSQGELSHLPPPGGQQLLVRNARLYVAGGEAPDTVPASLFWAQGQGVAFGLGVELDFDQKGGAVAAVASMDEKLIVVKASGIYALVGDGPNNTGAGSDWSTPQEVPSDTGCTNPDSVATTPMGVVFQSPKGLRLLDRSMSLQYLGAPMENLLVGNVTSVVQVPSLDQLRFLFSGGQLVLDTFAKQWALYDNANATAGCIWNGQHVLNKSVQVGLEEPGIWSDFGSIFNLGLTTGWIDLNGIAGYARLYQLALLVEDPKFDGDFSGTISAVLSFREDTSPQALTITLQPNVLQYELMPNNEVATAIRLQLTVNRTIESQDLYLNAATFLVGLKKLRSELRGPQRYG